MNVCIVVCCSVPVYRMRFNFRRVSILQICNFCVFRVFKLEVAGYSGVEIFAGEIFVDVYGVSPYTTIVYGTCRGAKLAGLIVGFV